MSLKKVIKNQIDKYGPIQLDLFFNLYLTNKNYGYYSKKNRIGLNGDFITSPEISQVFGEMIAAFLSWLREYSSSNQPILFEAGPGNGTLLKDMIKVFNQTSPEFTNCMVYLLEKSSFFRKKIQSNLSRKNIKFINSVSDLPELPVFGVMNEFLDAVGVKQLKFDGCNWCWEVIDYKTIKNEIVFYKTKGSKIDQKELQNVLLPNKISKGMVIETSPFTETFISTISKNIASFGGGILIIDYGKSNNIGDTIKTIKNHTFDKFLENFGESDISHEVDFQALKNIADNNSARLIGPVNQGDFLEEIGLKTRITMLRKKNDPKGDRKLIAAYERLISSFHMGKIFKIALLVPKGYGIPPGFKSTEKLV